MAREVLNYVTCDFCGLKVTAEESNGWFYLQTVLTRPTGPINPAQVEAMKEAGYAVGPPADRLPPIVGGDFHSLDCIIGFCQAKKPEVEAAEKVNTPEDKPEPGQYL